MAERTLFCLVLLAFCITTCFTSIFNEDLTLPDGTFKGYPERYEGPPEAVDLADLIQGKNTILGIRELLNSIRLRRKKDDACFGSAGLGHNCNNKALLDELRKIEFMGSVAAPGRKRRQLP